MCVLVCACRCVRASFLGKADVLLDTVSATVHITTIITAISGSNIAIIIIMITNAITATRSATYARIHMLNMAGQQRGMQRCGILN